ncbi:LysR family transcriptional regulator [Lampropedia puyangensis]|uniref:LysR family transcriptional regulator n=1 Tax=Lampropedia puyangensis TaxID=1330072 RepID=A0A4S8FGQ8_9BURK|nr:LysR family transcriptional regulator [Lampropedia puyangensis]THU05052.1 LysR family transcriptional regulator [Lampropedia puyangensis]
MIHELKSLIAVTQEGTFAAAGQKIGLTQAAISAQMKRLEQELNLVLFERHGRAAQLTPAGHTVVMQAKEIIGLCHELGTEKTPLNVPQQTIHLGAIASLQRTTLPAILAHVHRLHPGCKSRIVPGVSLDLYNMVDSGELDMAAIIKPPFSLPSELRWITLANEPFELIAPRSIAEQDWETLLRTQPFIRYDRVSFGGRQVDRFLRKHKIHPKEVCELDELDAITELVKRRVGAALVPKTLSIKRWPSSIVTVDLGDQVFHREVGLVYHAAQPTSAAMQTMLDVWSQWGRQHALSNSDTNF